MKIGDRCFVHGYVDEIRKDTVIIRNNGGYFGTIPSEVITGELPSAQPERKTGKWIRIRKEADGNTLYECSECHKGDTHYESVTVRFCWNCGAKMEG